MPYAPPSEHSRKLIAGGCGVRYEVQLTVDGAGVVSKIDQMLVDVASADVAWRATGAAVAAEAKRQGSADLERAGRQKPTL